MVPEIGIPGLILILVVALLVFGPKRLPEMGRSLGRGMREFKDSITGKDRDDDESEASVPELHASSDAQPAGFCSSCGNALSADAQFCAKCGAPVESTTAVAAGQAASAERDS